MDTDSNGIVHEAPAIFGRTAEGGLHYWALSERKRPFNAWNEDVYAAAVTIHDIAFIMFQMRSRSVWEKGMITFVIQLLTESKGLAGNLKKQSLVRRLKRNFRPVGYINRCGKLNKRALIFYNVEVTSHNLLLSFHGSKWIANSFSCST